MKSVKVILAVVAACALASALTTSASARGFSFSSQTFRATFRAFRGDSVAGTFICATTLEGSLHERNIAKVVGALIGYITRASLGACSQSTATILTATLPWHVRYAGFEGTLPNITGLRTDIIGFATAYRGTDGITCLFRSTATEPVRGEYAIVSGAVTSEALAGSIRLGAECFGALLTVSSDTGVVTVLNSTTRITVRLI